MKQAYYHFLLIFLLLSVSVGATFLHSCGNVGSEFDDPEDLGTFRNIRGSITSQSGSQGDMAGWVLALIDKESQIARLAEIDNAGLFVFSHVFLKLEYTLALLSPSLVLRAVLSHPNPADPTKIGQYFKITNGTVLPRIIQKGLVITWQETANINMLGIEVSDTDGDGVPEEVYSSLNTSSALLLHEEKEILQEGDKEEKHMTLTGQDADLDGINNELDSDIDGDGLINIFDHNDDGDVNTNGIALIDEFDTDANGDLIADLLQERNSNYFSRGAKWIVLKYELIPGSGSGVFNRYLTFVTKVHPELPKKPQSVQIRRNPSFPLLDDASIETINADGQIVPLAWDGLLLDDGQSEDGGAGDGIYARRLKLKAGSTPTTNQVVSFQYFYGAWAQEFLYTFPPVSPLSPTPSYDSVSRSIIFNSSDSPFGTSTDFVWIIVVFEVQEDDSNKVVYTSQPIIGSELGFTLPDNIMEVGNVYRYKVIAQSQEKITGFSVYKIESRIINIP